MKITELHRWSISYELEHPESAEVMTDLREYLSMQNIGLSHMYQTLIESYRHQLNHDNNLINVGKWG